MEQDVEVSVKDIVNFYIKINDASKAKRDFTPFSSKDKLAAFEIVQSSSASSSFKIEIAKYFLFDLDPRIRRKAEMMLEDLVPDWVSDPAESILKLLKAAEDRGSAHRDTAVKFLFGIVDANSLRDTFITLLNGRNRVHMAEILAILEKYVDDSVDEQEQVKIFDACLDIVLSDDTDQNIKFHASNLLSAFFKKVESTRLGQVLRQKFIERQVDKAEGVYRYLCSGDVGLSTTFLEDLLRPLEDGGKTYQLKIVQYLGYVLEKSDNPAEVDTVLDTYPDYWNQNEPSKEDKIKSICNRILQALEKLWNVVDDEEVRSLIIRITYARYIDKKELLEQISARIEREVIAGNAREKVSQMLRCFLHQGEDDLLKLQAARLLFFKLGGTENRAKTLELLKLHVESKVLKGELSTELCGMMQSLVKEKGVSGTAVDKASYIRFIVAPQSFQDKEEQKSLLAYLSRLWEGEGLESAEVRKRVLDSLAVLSNQLVSEELQKTVVHLEGVIRKRMP
ncbi:hypothetical protein [Pelotalea chapellei]|uniref:Uncharacterized protein n=1 Tax=Pelotalea chapellei TaxID=44671 RepID=A0ABS5UA59_9BACT|nr:hypothetical protein [Pelotalea chapellei]MBT1072538.1 hypothetical protein [Pelotalea chapellei]